ncbi:hypothetical protein P4I03_16805, partial [Bacillus cereus]|nr:hypothetical protein [Bacillus cereus]
DRSATKFLNNCFHYKFLLSSIFKNRLGNINPQYSCSYQKDKQKTPSQISEDGAVTGKGKQKTELIKKPPKKEYHKKMISLFCR